MRLVKGNTLHFASDGRHGWIRHVEQVNRWAPAYIRQAYDGDNHEVKGAKIFNKLPTDVWNYTSDDGDIFQVKLNYFLKNFPDEPIIQVCWKGCNYILL